MSVGCHVICFGMKICYFRCHIIWWLFIIVGAAVISPHPRHDSEKRHYRSVHRMYTENSSMLIFFECLCVRNSKKKTKQQTTAAAQVAKHINDQISTTFTEMHNAIMCMKQPYIHTQELMSSSIRAQSNNQTNITHRFGSMTIECG